MAIHSKWSAGNLTFYDGLQDIMTIKDNSDGVHINTSKAIPNLNDGSAFGLTIEVGTTGVATGNAAALASWLELYGTALSGSYYCAQTNGIYAPGTITGTRLTFGMRMQAILTGSDFQRLCPFSLNTNKTVTALFSVGDPGNEIGFQGSSGYCGAFGGMVPLMVDSGNRRRYVKTYSTA